MGPLFSIAIAVTGFAIVVFAAFAVLCLFRRPGAALALALPFTIGAFLGVGVGVLAAMPVVGIGQTLNSGVAVASYLGWLCAAAFVCGSLGVRLASSVLTGCSIRAPSAPAER